MSEEQVEEKTEEAAEAVAPEVEQEQQEVQKGPSFNWEQARGVMAAQKAEIDALKAHMAHLAAVQRPQQQEDEPDETEKLDPTEVPTVEQARKMIAKQARKEAQSIVQEYLQNHQLQTSEQKMKETYEDYDYVVETYALPLIKNDPALAYQVKNSRNPAETAYRLGKLSDKYQESTTQQPVSPKAEKILKNTKRPLSANAVGSTLKSQVDDVTKMSHQQVWDLSQKYAKGA